METKPARPTALFLIDYLLESEFVEVSGGLMIHHRAHLPSHVVRIYVTKEHGLHPSGGGCSQLATHYLLVQAPEVPIVTLLLPPEHEL